MYRKSDNEPLVTQFNVQRFTTTFTPQPQEELPLPPAQREPETILGEHISVKGQLKFNDLLRIDGTFEGELLSEGTLIVGPTGVIKADLNLKDAFISGKVEGNISVSGRLILRGNAEIHGNITAQYLGIDEGVSILGQVTVFPPNIPE
jgi:cytoskeletal protein CcmA (bactofilin family)